MPRALSRGMKQGTARVLLDCAICITVIDLAIWVAVMISEGDNSFLSTIPFLLTLLSILFFMIIGRGRIEIRRQTAAIAAVLLWVVGLLGLASIGIPLLLAAWLAAVVAIRRPQNVSGV